MFDALADACRWIGEQMLASAERGQSDIDAVDIPKGLLGWIARIVHDLARAAERVSDWSDGE